MKAVRGFTDEHHMPLDPHPFIKPHELDPDVKGIRRDRGNQQAGAFCVHVDQDANTNLSLVRGVPHRDRKGDTRHFSALAADAAGPPKRTHPSSCSCA
jgi:hypothetical protein